MLDAAKLRVDVVADTSKAEAGLQGFSKTMQGHARSLGAVGVGMTAAFTAPLVGIATQAFKLAADFEQSMDVMAVAGEIPAESMAHFERQALDLGAATVFSAGEVAGAMLELTKAGMDMFEVSASIKGVTDLAAAGGVNLGEAANVTTQYLNSFNLEAEKAGQLADLFAGGANASSAELYDLALGGVQAAGTFADIGASASDLITALAILANRGQDASVGGTNLNRAFSDLMSPTKIARKEMKKLGIDIFDVHGEFVGIIPMIEEFNEATAGMTQEQREASLGIILGQSGLRAMRPLLEAGAEGFAEMQAEVDKEAQAALLSEARMRGLAGGIEYLSGSVDSFLIGAARPFLDFTGDALRGLGDFITSIGNLPDPIKNAALAFGAVLAAAGPIIGVAAAVAFALSALGTAAAPILLVTAAVAGLAAGFAALYSANLFGIQGAIAGIGTAVSGLVTNPVDTLKGAWDGVKAAIQGTIDTLAAWKDQISTQGLISEETFIASFELPPAWREILQFTIGMGAALKVLKDAATGVETAKLAELNGILESAFGAEIATRIGNMATHITTLKTALSGATSVGDWVTALSGFARGMGAEIDAIADDAKKQIKEKIEAIDFTLKIGSTNIEWGPELKLFEIPGVFTVAVTPTFVGVESELVKALATKDWGKITIGAANIEWATDLKLVEMGPFKAVLTPDFSAAELAGISLRVTPDWAVLEVGDTKIFELQTKPKWVPDAAPLTIQAKPDWQLDAGPLKIIATPEWTMANVGPLTVQVTPEFTKVDIGKQFGAQISSTGKIDIKMGAENFTVDLTGPVAAVQTAITLFQNALAFDFSAAIATAQIKIAAFQGEVAAAWTTEGWNGLGALATEKITALGGTLTTALTNMIAAAEEALTPKPPPGPTAEILRETETKPFAGAFVDRVAGDLATAVEEFNFTETAVSVLGGLSLAIATGDFSLLGSTLAGKVKEAVTGAFTSKTAMTTLGIGAAVVDTLFPSIKTSILGITWGFTSDNFSKLKTNVIDAFKEIDWSLIAASVTIFKQTVNQAFGGFLMGILEGATGLKVPQWITDLSTWEPKVPAWIETLQRWASTTPAWVTALKDWTPAWVAKLLGWDPTPAIDASLALLRDLARKPLPTSDAARFVESWPNQAPIELVPEIDAAKVDAIIASLEARPPGKLPIVPTITVDVPDFDTAPIADILRGPYEVQVTPVLSTSTSDILRGVYEDIGGADQKLSFHVEAASVTAAAGLSPMQVDAIIGHLDPPIVMPTIDVKANIVGGLDSLTPDTSGLMNAGAAIGSTLSGFRWPALPTWQWPPLPVFSWPALPEWRWPAIPAPAWLDRLQVPRPSWLGELLAWSPTVQIAQQAVTTPGQLQHGTSYWRGGWAKVGEEGEEYVNLPRGSKVFDHETSMQMAADAGGGGVTINMYVTANTELDWEQMAYRIKRILDRRS